MFLMDKACCVSYVNLFLFTDFFYQPCIAPIFGKSAVTDNQEQQDTPQGYCNIRIDIH